MATRRKLERAQVTAGNKALRVLWNLCWVLLYRPSPTVLHGWRRLLLRLFGARIGKGAHPYPAARIWAPWNLAMDDHSCLANHVDCYCVAPVRLGRHATVSQYSYICTASHDVNDPALPLVVAPVTVEAGAWVAARAFIGPGVVIHQGAVVGACAAVFGDVAPWSIVVGNPAAKVGERGAFGRRAEIARAGARSR